MNKSDLINPCQYENTCCQQKDTTILGAIILRISSKDDRGRQVETRQLTYIPDNSYQLFQISREACIALRMIYDRFPTNGKIGEKQLTVLWILTTSQTTAFFWEEHINRLLEEWIAAIISNFRMFSSLERELFCCNTGSWQITLFLGRFAYPAESRYAPVKGKALAVVDAFDEARYFVPGYDNFIIAVDHKPLLKIFRFHGYRSLESISKIWKRKHSDIFSE